MDVRLPDGRVITNVPEGTTREQLASRLAAGGYNVPAEWTAQAAAPKSAPLTAYQEGKGYGGTIPQDMARGFMSVAQGPTFGFADELAGAIGGGYKALTGAGSFADNYKATRDFWRGAAAAEEEAAPVSTLVTRGMASAPTWLFGGGQTQAMSMGGRALQAGKVGGITGAISGAGQSEATTPLGVALDSARSGALGFGMSAASVPVAAGMGNMAENVASRVSDTAAARYAKEKVAEALARDARGSAVLANPGSPLTQATTRMTRLGPEARVVDAGGQNARQLLDTLATLPGRTKDATEAAIRSRQSTRADRLINAATSSMQTGGQRAASVVDDLIRTRAEASAPLYQRLHRLSVKGEPDLLELVKAAEAVGAGKEAKKIADALSLPYTLTSQPKGGLDALMNPSQGALAMRDLDHLKQGLDTLIERAHGQDGRLTPTGYALTVLKDRLTTKLDDMTGGFYAQARQAFAGPSALISATNNGRRFLSLDDAATRAALSGLSESEKEAFRLGAFEALRNKAGRPGGQTELLGMWKDKILREKLQAVFPNERAFREFAVAAAKEARMKGLEGVGRGSQTAARQYGAGDLDVPALVDTAQAVAGMNSPAGVLSGAARVWNRVQTPEPVRDQMGRLLLTQGPDGRTTLQQMEDLLRQINESRTRQAQALGLGLGSQVSAPIGGVLSPQTQPLLAP